jgi:hypothetical protein
MNLTRNQNTQIRSHYTHTSAPISSPSHSEGNRTIYMISPAHSPEG